MTNSRQDVLGSKSQAIANARRLLNNGDCDKAAEQAREIIDQDATCAEAYRLLGMALRKAGDVEGAKLSEMTAIELSSLHPDVFRATMAIAENGLDTAEHLLRAYLRNQPDDATALRLLAEVGARMGRLDGAESILESALVIAPHYRAAQLLLQKVREASKRSADAPLVKQRFAPRSALAQFDEALQLYERVIAKFPDIAENWVNYGHVLRTIGKQKKAVTAYRRAIELHQASGVAWWALADLKIKHLDHNDIRRLSGLVDNDDVSDTDRIGLHFALGRALEQAGQFERAFESYVIGNRLRAEGSRHDRDAVTRHVDASIKLFDRTFFDERRGAGFDAPDPIFILGMPRAGSTLLEQILSSHADVEGTTELPDIGALANWLGDGKHAGIEDSGYLHRLEALPPSELRKLGQGYLWGTRQRRPAQKPFFTDKMPNNWLHLGMILTILPNAKIVDARRHPMACGLSLFRQHFAKGQEFSYDLTDIGSFYANYERMMRHFDRVMPGRIIRVIHEELVQDPEGRIRALLAQLDLPFDEACLRFHTNRRAVRTSSSEQVRRPITPEGVDQWRSFEPWLDPLKEALGPVLECYPKGPR